MTLKGGTWRVHFLWQQVMNEFRWNFVGEGCKTSSSWLDFGGYLTSNKPLDSAADPVQVCPVVCVCNCHVLKHVLKQWVVQISSIYTCDWYWYAFYDFCTLLVLRSTAAVLCNNENTFMCWYVVCTCANTFAMLCICREFHGVSVLWSKAWRW